MSIPSTPGHPRHPLLRRGIAATVSLACLAALSACGVTFGAPDSSSREGGQRTLTVLAASSLTETFDQLAKTFESENKGVKVKLVYDSSATLAEQTIQGAPGGVLATADKQTMQQAVSGGGTSGKPTEFATNVLVLAVPADNPAGITALSDLNQPKVDYLTCVATAPCGAAAAELLPAAGVTRAPVSREVDVKSVLSKVEEGDADAGLVYRTDVTASDGKVTGLQVPGAAADPNPYYVAVTKDAKHRVLAAAWVKLLVSTAGQKILDAAGFGRP